MHWDGILSRKLSLLNSNEAEADKKTVPLARYIHTCIHIHEVFINIQLCELGHSENR